MPMLVCREVQDEASFVGVENVACNTHDLIAHLMNKAAAASNIQHNGRKILQCKASEILYNRFDAWHENNKELKTTPLETSYPFFAEFTRSYIQSYMLDPSKILDIRILPVNEVDNNNDLHLKTRDFARAQNILYGPLVGYEDVGVMTYAQCVQLSADRLSIDSITAII
jgi:hypothetical protein